MTYAIISSRFGYTRIFFAKELYSATCARCCLASSSRFFITSISARLSSLFLSDTCKKSICNKTRECFHPSPQLFNRSTYVVLPFGPQIHEFPQPRLWWSYVEGDSYVRKTFAGQALTAQQLLHCTISGWITGSTYRSVNVRACANIAMRLLIRRTNFSSEARRAFSTSSFWVRSISYTHTLLLTIKWCHIT